MSVSVSQNITQVYTKIKENIGKVIVGKEDTIDMLLVSMLCGGHVLLEDVPGTGKTMLIKSLAASVGCDFKRIQFTPDLLPSDITGINFFNMKKSEFEFVPGPIFANIVLADEINRATPKTQSALLEAMQEHTVTVMGVSRKLEEPFFVLATQNPVEQDGTYPLPEAQMDRFMFKIIVKMPNMDELMDIVNMTQKTMAEVADAACTGEQLLEMRKTANAIPVATDVMKYAMMLCSASHPDSEHAAEASKKYIRLGASPRAGQALISAAKVKALMNGRYNVSYNDINELALPVLRHRIKLTFEAVAERVGADEIVEMIVEELMVRNKLKEAAPKVEENAENEKKAKKFGRK
mgnify:CR=1 FL=1